MSLNIDPSNDTGVMGTVRRRIWHTCHPVVFAHMILAGFATAMGILALLELLLIDQFTVLDWVVALSVLTGASLLTILLTEFMTRDVEEHYDLSHEHRHPFQRHMYISLIVDSFALACVSRFYVHFDNIDSFNADRNGSDVVFPAKMVAMWFSTMLLIVVGYCVRSVSTIHIIQITLYPRLKRFLRVARD